ncbi:hypothetical protein PYCCODRAFT_1429618 [Trametes coccinea BRFM310]|uniref:Fanconi-associated nuclease n=1 Tax=Trametes coccinea (strain BRFM310) TaxID=1353009 RepID=A0A1Y2J574_TRAC3|nr:hypothetical protein PYCCODRAFT_1429618 [Trametes coccinea BRFM310]
MVLGSPSASLANKLVFWSPDTDDTSHAEDGPSSADAQDGAAAKAEGSKHDGVSMYVKLFEDMLKDVIDGEAHLFVEDELNCFMKYHRLPYEAKYLFCRLCLRKTDKWHRLSSLKYESELGDGIVAAVETLCGRPQAPAPAAQEEDVKPAVDGINSILPDLEPRFRLPGPPVKTEPDTEPHSLGEPAAFVKSEESSEVQDDVNPVLKTSATNPSSFPVIMIEDREVIDLTFDDDGDETEVEAEVLDDKFAQAGPSASPVYEPSTPSLTPRAPDFSVFADDEEQASLLELLDCLTTDELHDIARQLKLKTKVKKRDILIDSILRSSSTQGTLAFPVVGSRKGKEKAKVQSKLPFGAKAKPLTQTVLPFKPREPYRTQQDRVRDIVMDKLQKCIRLNADVVALFRRANLVYFRSTQHTSELLTPALLARAKKRAYPTYPYARTHDIWRTRAELLAYEDALAVEAEVDALLENTTSSWGGGRDRSSTASRTPGLGPGMGMGRGSRTPVAPSKGGSVAAETPESVRGRKGQEEEEESVRMKNARAVTDILECIYPRWERLVATKPEVEDEDGRRKALQRFECGHILTRVVCKGAHALGILHQYDRELEVLNALLAQTRWRRGRRGRWHDRRALLLMNHLRPSTSSPSSSTATVTAISDHDSATLQSVIAALEDADTHIVFRPMLERRLTRLEKWLDVPVAERHQCVGRLAKAGEVFVKGVRVDRRLRLDEAGRVLGGKADGNGAGVLSWANRRETSPQKRGAQDEPEKFGGKSVWKGRDGEEVSVEALALQHYEDRHGCKGFHSEGRIVTTLFGLLFWDVLFAPIPGAFETRYQAAPLDLAEDTFYYARQDLADARLAEIEAGRAAEILDGAWTAHEGVVCVGVRWDLFAREDLVEIVKCINGKALAVICRLMCEDYAGRTGGVPDLLVWNEAEGWAKFVEVKGPGDSLQENQKVWIDVLLQAGMPVEVCHVYEAGSTPKKVKPKPKPKPQAKGSSARKVLGKRKTGAGQKRKRGTNATADTESDSDESVRIVESEDDEDEENVDYSQLDRYTDEEVEEVLEPPKKKRRKNGARDEPESPVARKVARLNSQPEILNAV